MALSRVFSFSSFTLTSMTGETTQQTKFLKGGSLECPQPLPHRTFSILGNPWGQLPFSSLFSATRQAAQLVLATLASSPTHRPVTWQSETGMGYYCHYYFLKLLLVFFGRWGQLITRYHLYHEGRMWLVHFNLPIVPQFRRVAVPPVVRCFPVVVFFDHGHPCFRNFHSAVPVDAITAELRDLNGAVWSVNLDSSQPKVDQQ